MGEIYETALLKDFRKSFWEKEILLGILFVSFCIWGVSIFEGNHVLPVIAAIYLLGAAFLLVKYLTYPIEGNQVGFLAGVLKYHAFDEGSLFRKLGTKILILETIMGAAISISLFLQQKGTFIPATVLLLVAPAILFVLTKMFYAYRKVHELPTASVFFGYMIMGLVKLAVYIGLLVYAIMVWILGYAFVSVEFENYKLPENIVAYRVYDNWLMGVSIIVLALYAVSVFCYRKERRFLKWISAGLLVVLMGCFGGALLMERANNTVIMENRIVHTANFEVTEYTFEDVDLVQVSMGKDQICMELTMRDGVIIPVVGNEYTNSEAWDAQYYSIYNYLADLTKQLLQAGARGSVQDVVEIRAYVVTLDTQCMQGTEELITLLQ